MIDPLEPRRTHLTLPTTVRDARSVLRDDIYELRRVRCACRGCGAHLIAPMCFAEGAACRTCGSFDVHPISPAASDR